MDLKVIKGVENYLYDDICEFDTFRPGNVVIDSWRDGNEGDWVYTDDSYVCQILKVFTVKSPSGKKVNKCVRTVCGSYVTTRKTRKMLGKDGVAKNIYTFSGTYDTNKDLASKKVTSRKMLFARYVAAGMDTVKAYKIVYPKAEDEQYIKSAVHKLLQQNKVMNMIDEETRRVLEEEGVSPSYLIRRYKDIADLSERDSDKLRSLDALSKISGLFETEKKKEQLTVWAGFSPEQLEALKDDNSTKILAHTEKEE